MDRKKDKLIEAYRDSKEGYNHMKLKVLYNIPKRCWHNIALSFDAEVSITEDANTHLGDYEFHYLNEKEQKELYELIQSVWKK